MMKGWFFGLIKYGKVMIFYIKNERILKFVKIFVLNVKNKIIKIDVIIIFGVEYYGFFVFNWVGRLVFYYIVSIFDLVVGVGDFLVVGVFLVDLVCIF